MKNSRKQTIVSYVMDKLPIDVKLFTECIDIIDELAERLEDNPTKEQVIQYLNDKIYRINKGLDSVLGESPIPTDAMNTLLENLSHTRQLINFIETYFK